MIENVCVGGEKFIVYCEQTILGAWLRETGDEVKARDHGGSKRKDLW